MQKAMMPLAGISFGLILFQGASGWAQVGGADWGHGHTAHLLTLVAIGAAFVAVKGEFSAESKVKPHAFALAGLAVIQEGIGSGLMSMSWNLGWLHIVLALVMAGHAFALLMLTKMALATDSESTASDVTAETVSK
jgi:hypothetical protein